MVVIEPDGRIAFTVHVPDAERVQVVGAFHGWDEQHLPMHRQTDGRWRLTIDPGPGTYLFRYLVDGSRWTLDEAAHGIHRTVDARTKSRIWRPPLYQDPDSLAA
jgi:1,4-alpha-glucan branching enzyme